MSTHQVVNGLIGLGLLSLVSCRCCLHVSADDLFKLFESVCCGWCTGEKAEKQNFILLETCFPAAQTGSAFADLNRTKADCAQDMLLMNDSNMLVDKVLIPCTHQIVFLLISSYNY